jgi:hypothetical protein
MGEELLKNSRADELRDKKLASRGIFMLAGESKNGPDN